MLVARRHCTRSSVILLMVYVCALSCHVSAFHSTSNAMLHRKAMERELPIWFDMHGDCL